MTIREKTYAVLRAQVAQKHEDRVKILDDLRKDEYFDDLYRSLNSLRWDCVLKKGAEQAEAEKKLRENEAAMKNYLADKGYTKKILSDTESCELCHDTGVYRGRMCACADAIRQNLELQRSPLLKDVPANLDDVDLAVYGEYKTKYAKYVRFLRAMVVDGETNFAVITGKTGTGKSYLACTATREYMKKGGSVLALNAMGLSGKFLEYHCAFPENKREVWSELTEPDLLLIDDLGVEPMLNNVTVPYLYALLVERIDKKTVITTNLDVMRFGERYGERIVSRLLDKRKGSMMVFEGEDLRF